MEASGRNVGDPPICLIRQRPGKVADYQDHIHSLHARSFEGSGANAGGVNGWITIMPLSMIK